MRDDSGKHPEIVDAYQRGEHFFAAIGLRRHDVERVFELGISEASHRALRNVLQSRPFDTMPGTVYRYVFLPIYSRNEGDRATADIRVEQGRDARNLRFELPKQLIANLLWFEEMQSFEPASRLRSWKPGETAAQRDMPIKRAWWRTLLLRRPARE